MISQYWVGQIPMNNLTIGVLRSDGREADCSNYHTVRVRMVDSDNQEVDLKGSYLDETGKQWGRFVFEWPRDRSLFTKTGDYVLQLVLESQEWIWVYDNEGGGKGFGIGIVPPPGHEEIRQTRDITTEHTIRVRDIGGKK